MNSTGKRIHGHCGVGNRKFGGLAGLLGFFLLFLLLPTSALGANVDKIVDNQPVVSKNNAGFWMKKPGRWSVQNKAQAYNGNHRYSGHKNPKVARWQPDLSESGYYAVYVRWVEAADRDHQVEYKIEYNNGAASYKRKINQKNGGGVWFRITNPNRADGKFYFKGGANKNEYIQIKMKNTNDGNTISADAVRFVKEVATTTTTTPTTTTTTTSTTTTTTPPTTTTTTTTTLPPLGPCDVDPDPAVYNWFEAEGPTVPYTDNFSVVGPEIVGLYTSLSGPIGTPGKYVLNFKAAGTYYLWLYATAPGGSGSDNSAWYGLNGARVGNISVQSPFPTNKHWINQHWNTGNPGLDGPLYAQITIPGPGTYTLNLWTRESGFRIDAIALTTSGGLPSANRQMFPDTCGGTTTTTTTVPTTTTTTTTTLPPPVVCDIIIDNDDLITENQGENDTRGFYFKDDNADGDWAIPAISDTDAYNGDHYESTNEGAEAYWAPMLPRAGNWEVFVRYADSRGYDNNAEYRVERRGSKSKIEVNQKKNGGLWVSLGTFNFGAGNSKDNNVRLSQEKRTKEVSADAVRFVEVGCSATTTTTVPSGPTTTTTTTTIPLPACTYVVDNTDGSPTFTTSGSWSTQSHVTAYGGTYSTSDQKNDIAYFTPPLIYAGIYRVSIWYVGDSSMYTDNRLRIYYDGGASRDTIDLDQTSGGGQWLFIAQYSFLGNDPDELVRLEVRKNKKYASADAVKFERVGGCPGPTTTTTTTTLPSTTTTTTTTTSTTTTTVTSPTTTTTTTVPLPPGSCANEPIADIPLDAMMQPAPAILMFALDDSGSMDWEFMTPESDGLFKGERYVFDNPGDNLYGDSYIISGSDREFWRSRWSGYNFMYFNPREKYTPWPIIPGVTGLQSPAHPDTPRSHPQHASPTFNLSSTYDTVDSVAIARAHYFDYIDQNGNEVLDVGEPVYLANLVSATNTIDYYRVTEDGNGRITALTLVTAASIPAGFTTSYADARQNFANWYSFYRRRELTATAAVSNVIIGLDGVQVGIRSINGRIVQPVLQIKVGATDQTAALLNKLYGMVLQANGTPLRRGLQDVGQYLHQDDGNNGGNLGNSPYADTADGGSCQQAFTVVMTDGYYNGSSPGVGNVDGNNGVPYADSWSDTLADVAMYYYENDLASGLEGVVPTTADDTNPEQHMVTYGVSFGVFGSLNPNDYNLEDGPLPVWPNPFDGNNDNRNKIDDLWHASVNGRGIFLSARNPIELVHNLRAVMQNIASREGSAASVSVNGDELNEEVSGEIRMYQTIYHSDGWRGDMKSFLIDTTTGIPDTDNPVWSAAVQMTDMIGADGANHTQRILATYDAEDIYATATGVGMPFDATIMATTTNQWQLLDPTPATAANILNFIRGDRSNEEQSGGSLRNRFSGEGDSVLGDMIHSRAIYYEDRISPSVGGVDDCIGDGSGVDNQACMLFVGGNDGMLHAFNAVTGDEAFAYIPGLVFENIHETADPAYSHRYFVDNTPSVREFDDISFLVGGLGKGGRGYFALNVKNPETIVNEADLSARALWEYPTPGTTDPDMGYSFSESTVLKTYDSSINTGEDYEGYVLFFGNGYSSPDGQAVLYILNPRTGGVIRKINAGSSSECNGLSSPAAVDVNNDGMVDYVYAGDLLGNMWKFDLTSDDHTQWSVAYADSGAGRPLFTASGDRSTGSTGVQAITTRPDVMFQCYLEKGYLVIFGTGKYLENGDVSDTSLETIYAVWDYGDDDDDSEFLGRFETDNPQNLSNQASDVTLLEQTAIFDGLVDVDGDGDMDDWFRVLSNNQINLWTADDVTDGQNPNPAVDGRGSDLVDNDGDGEIDEADEKVAHAGWFFDLPISKERVVTNLLIRDNRVIVISFTPTEGSCSGRGGSSVVNELDACNGGRVGTWVTAADLVYDIDGDGDIDFDDYDSDPTGGDGELNIHELFIDLNGDGKYDQHDFDLMDINGDGVITANEFNGKLDTNGDGAIDEFDQIFIERPILDINHDNVIDRDDYIIIDLYDPVTGTYIPGPVPPSGGQREGMLYPPPILRMDDIEKKYMSSSTGLIEIFTELSEKRGMNYWKKVQ